MKLTSATYAQALDMFKKSARLGQEALAAREQVSIILGISGADRGNDYQQDCVNEAALEAFYSESEADVTVLFHDALHLAGINRP